MNMLTEKQAAERAGVSRRSLQRWRLAGKPVPANTVHGGRVMYRADDVEAWVESRFPEARYA